MRMIFAKKSLGQNFLRSQKALSQIVEAGDIQHNDVIVEIGPGEGVLTGKILEKCGANDADGNSVGNNGGRLIAIEKDDRLIPILEEKFRKYIDSGTLKLIHGDVVEFFKKEGGLLNGLMDGQSTDSVHKGENKGKHKSALTYKIIANIPYYITGLIIRQIFEQAVLPEKVVLLVQKEVAERIVARGDNGKQGAEQGGKESLLSLSIKLYGTPRIVARVPRGAFVPAPTVDSAIVCIDNIQRKIPLDDELRFFAFLKAAFSHKRKRLIKNVTDADVVGGGAIFTTDALEKALATEGLDTNTRAEDVSLTQYINIFRNI